MIVDLPDTSTSQISKRLIELRSDSGAMALSRVLTLVVLTDEVGAEAAIATATAASRQHPSRIVVVVSANRRGKVRIDGQLRVGGDAGASEIIVLRLYGELAGHARSVVTPLLLADSPIVAWWPGTVPSDPSADPVGAMAQRRVTDSARMPGNPRAVLDRLAKAYTDGDTDLAWTRITLWRGLLAAALDQAPYEPVSEATVVGAPDSPSADLLAAWLAYRLKCPVRVARSKDRTGIISVRLERASGPLDLVRPQDGNTATLCQPGQPDRAIALPHRTDAECLSDELRRLDPDEVYQDALTRGLRDVTVLRRSAAEVVRAGDAASPVRSGQIAARIKRDAEAAEHSSMVEKMPEPSGTSDPDTVKQVSRDRLAEKQS